MSMMSSATRTFRRFMARRPIVGGYAESLESHPERANKHTDLRG